MNLKFTISYDGSSFLGSQKQPSKPTVEGELLAVFKTLNIDTKIVLSGRTDKNIHGLNQVFNCKVPNYWSDLEKLQLNLNRHINPSIKIKQIRQVDDNFHARFSAKKRVYRYLISTKELNPFNQKYLSYEKNIDEDRIKDAIKEFIGIHDFRYFHKLGSQKEVTIKEIYDAKFYKHKELYIIKFSANSYLRSQIRLMVAFLIEISRGKLSKEDLKKQLDLKKQVLSKPASANGLYLAKIFY